MDIRIAEGKTGIAECLALRHAVFILEQGVSEAEERDGLDGTCTHVLASENGVPVGAARINWAIEDVAKIQRVCVGRPSRGRGVGAAVIRFIIAHVRNGGQCSAIRLGSQTHALEFYRKLGFSEIGDVYMDAGIPHRDMELRL